MDSSFFEYRDEAVANSDSETEIIDDSCDESKIKKKNCTAFVAETDESNITDDESEADSEVQNKPLKSVVGRSVADNYIVSSSDDDASRRGSIRRQSESSSRLVLSSSDDEQVSPEILPKRRPPIRQSIASNDSFIGRKTKKRMMLLDSDTENSIVIEHNKHTKLVCLKDTPLKTDHGVRNGNDSDGRDEDGSDTGDDTDSDDGNVADVRKCSDDDNEKNNKKRSSIDDNEVPGVSSADDESPVYGSADEDDDDEGDDHMVMSRATRMSIMGTIPKENDSDESDFIESDESNRKSGLSGGSISDLPDAGVAPEDPQDPVEDLDATRITCSPFSSPLKDITNKTINNTPNLLGNKDECIIIDEPKENVPSVVTNKVQNFIKYDDDVTIIDTKPEIIALSSDDEDEVQPEKAPKVKKSPKNGQFDIKPVADESIKRYLVPPSYPNQVVYVKKHVRENELNKLEALKGDLKNIRYLLEEMDVDTLPDGGGKLIERLTQLEEEVRRQGDKVANMIVEPDNPTALDVAKDGFGPEDKKGLSWDDIQKASNAVQPRMFGKQAMATHMAERNMIMERLRDLYESLASRPAETKLATPPAGVSSQLMPHQLHALAWLQWRETQRPRAGILADDMGLGKTITMIALMVSDKQRLDDEDEDDDEDDDNPKKGKLVNGGTLVVCPASLIQQWGGEVGKHCAAHALAVCLHHGAARAQQPHRLAAHDLVVTTYNILQRDNEKNGVLMRVRWRRVILDEAHIVRNHKSATSGAVSSLRARRRWCLTGTPVQNKDLDLFALLKFLRCSPFDDLTMWKKWIDNKSLGGQERLSTIMRSILLRRTKVQLQQKGQLDCLPERSVHECQVTLTKPEMNVYQKVLVFSKTLFAQFLHQRAEKNSDGASGFMASAKNSEYDKMHKKMIALQGAQPVKSHEILVLLLRLRQVCCHCGLIAAMLDEEGAEEVEEEAAGKDLLAELNKLSLEDSRSRRKSNKLEENADEEPEPEGTTAAEAIRSVLSPNNPVFDLSNPSSKIKAVMDCLEENVLCNPGHKAVVVSQWTSVLRLVAQQLAARRVRSVTLSGAVPVPARAPLIRLINDPNSDVKVMLLSLCAGGVGLNLCGANHLLLLDPHWNPQLEEQAQDRIYRVGQKKSVHIYRFMSVDTVEQTIRKLQQVKLELAENVLTGAKNTNGSKLSIEELKMLFNMGPTPTAN